MNRRYGLVLVLFPDDTYDSDDALSALGYHSKRGVY